MTNQNPCPKLDDFFWRSLQAKNLHCKVKKLEASDTTVHLGRAVREVLLAMQSIVDAVIETKERRTETNLERVTIE